MVLLERGGGGAYSRLLFAALGMLAALTAAAKEYTLLSGYYCNGGIPRCMTYPQICEGYNGTFESCKRSCDCIEACSGFTYFAEPSGWDGGYCELVHEPCTQTYPSYGSYDSYINATGSSVSCEDEGIPLPDTQAPMIQELSVSETTVDFSADNASSVPLNITIRATDDTLGLHKVQLHMESLDSAWMSFNATGLSAHLATGTETNGTWELTLHMPSFLRSGRYIVNALTILCWHPFYEILCFSFYERTVNVRELSPVIDVQESPSLVDRSSPTIHGFNSLRISDISNYGINAYEYVEFNLVMDVNVTVGKLGVPDCSLRLRMAPWGNYDWREFRPSHEHGAETSQHSSIRIEGWMSMSREVSIDMLLLKCEEHREFVPPDDGSDYWPWYHPRTYSFPSRSTSMQTKTWISMTDFANLTNIAYSREDLEELGEHWPNCSLPSSHMGYTILNCPANSRADDCTMACDTDSGYLGEAYAGCGANGGTFELYGCYHPDPACYMPSDMPGYLADCPNLTTSSQCTVTCDTGNFYHGHAEAYCSTYHGVYSLYGCWLSPKCDVPSPLVGYTATNCTGYIHAVQCTGLECAPGYRRNGYPVVEAWCNFEGDTMSFYGCIVEPKCTASPTTGYELTGCDTSGGPILESSCNPICAINYSGVAFDTCASENADFTFSGCDPQCVLPTIRTGYAVSGCSGLTTAASCAVGCASGYVGVAALTCPSAGGLMSFSGCTPPVCFLAVTPGYVPTLCNTDFGPINEDQCIVSCAAGYSGSPVATCSTNDGTFAFSGCQRTDVNSTTALSSSTATSTSTSLSSASSGLSVTSTSSSFSSTSSSETMTLPPALECAREASSEGAMSNISDSLAPNRRTASFRFCPEVSSSYGLAVTTTSFEPRLRLSWRHPHGGTLERTGPRGRIMRHFESSVCYDIEVESSSVLTDVSDFQLFLTCCFDAMEDAVCSGRSGWESSPSRHWTPRTSPRLRDSLLSTPYQCICSFCSSDYSGWNCQQCKFGRTLVPSPGANGDATCVDCRTKRRYAIALSGGHFVWNIHAPSACHTSMQLTAVTIPWTEGGSKELEFDASGVRVEMPTCDSSTTSQVYLQRSGQDEVIVDCVSQPTCSSIGTLSARPSLPEEELMKLNRSVHIHAFEINSGTARMALEVLSLLVDAAQFQMAPVLLGGNTTLWFSAVGDDQALPLGTVEDAVAANSSGTAMAADLLVSRLNAILSDEAGPPAAPWCGLDEKETALLMPDGSVEEGKVVLLLGRRRECSGSGSRSMDALTKRTATYAITSPFATLPNDICPTFQWLDMVAYDSLTRSSGGCVNSDEVAFSPSSVQAMRRVAITFTGVCNVLACCFGDSCSTFSLSEGGVHTCYTPLLSRLGAHSVLIMTFDGFITNTSQSLTVTEGRGSNRVHLRTDGDGKYLWLVRPDGKRRSAQFVAVGVDGYEVLGGISRSLELSRWSPTTRLPSLPAIDHLLPFSQPVGIVAIRVFEPREELDPVARPDGFSSDPPQIENMHNESDEAVFDEDIAADWEQQLSSYEEEKIRGYVNHLLLHRSEQGSGGALGAIRKALASVQLHSSHPPEERPCRGTDSPDTVGKCYWAWSEHAGDAVKFLVTAGFSCTETDWDLFEDIVVLAQFGDIVVLPRFEAWDNETGEIISMSSGDIAVRHNESVSKAWVSDAYRSFSWISRVSMELPNSSSLDSNSSSSVPSLCRLVRNPGLWPEVNEVTIPFGSAQDIMGTDSTEAGDEAYAAWVAYDLANEELVNAAQETAAIYKCPMFWGRLTIMPRELRPSRSVWGSGKRFRCLTMEPSPHRAAGVTCCYDSSNRYVPAAPSMMRYGHAPISAWRRIQEDGAASLVRKNLDSSPSRRLADNGADPASFQHAPRMLLGDAERHQSQIEYEMACLAEGVDRESAGCAWEAGWIVNRHWRICQEQLWNLPLNWWERLEVNDPFAALDPDIALSWYTGRPVNLDDVSRVLRRRECIVVYTRGPQECAIGFKSNGRNDFLNFMTRYADVDFIQGGHFIPLFKVHEGAYKEYIRYRVPRLKALIDGPQCSKGLRIVSFSQSASIAGLLFEDVRVMPHRAHVAHLYTFGAPKYLKTKRNSCPNHIRYVLRESGKRFPDPFTVLAQDSSWYSSGQPVDLTRGRSVQRQESTCGNDTIVRLSNGQDVNDQAKTCMEELTARNVVNDVLRQLGYLNSRTREAEKILKALVKIAKKHQADGLPYWLYRMTKIIVKWKRLAWKLKYEKQLESLNVIFEALPGCAPLLPVLMDDLPSSLSLNDMAKYRAALQWLWLARQEEMETPNGVPALRPVNGTRLLFVRRDDDDDDDGWTPRNPPSIGWGDPHCASLDGKEFECNFLGEAIYAACGAWRIHVAAAVVGDGGGTAIIAVAVSHGNDAVTIIRDDGPSTNGTSIVNSGDDSGNTSSNSSSSSRVSSFYNIFVNGEEASFDIDSSDIGLVVQLDPDEAIVTIEDRNRKAFEVSLTLRETFISPVQVTPWADECWGQTEGLVGNGNGNRDDDYLPRFASAALDPESSCREVYEGFVMSWCVTALNDTLLGEEYLCDESYSPICSDEREDEILATCPEACNGRMSCCFDTNVDIAFLEASVEDHEVIEHERATSLVRGDVLPPQFVTDITEIIVPDASVSLPSRMLAVFEATHEVGVSNLTCSVCDEPEVECIVDGVGNQTASLELWASSLLPGTFECIAWEELGKSSSIFVDVSEMLTTTRTSSTETTLSQGSSSTSTSSSSSTVTTSSTSVSSTTSSTSSSISSGSSSTSSSTVTTSSTSVSSTTSSTSSSISSGSTSTSTTSSSTLSSTSSSTATSSSSSIAMSTSASSSSSSSSTTASLRGFAANASSSTSSSQPSSQTSTSTSTREILASVISGSDDDGGISAGIIIIILIIIFVHVLICCLFCMWLRRRERALSGNNVPSRDGWSSWILNTQSLTLGLRTPKH